jgi:hypothetical protein
MAKNIVLGQRKHLPDYYVTDQMFGNSFIDVRFKTWHYILQEKDFVKKKLEFLFWLICGV